MWAAGESPSGDGSIPQEKPDGSKLASCGDDGAIMLWDMGNGEYLRILRRDRPYERLNIAGIRGLTEAQKATLRALGQLGEFIGSCHLICASVIAALWRKPMQIEGKLTEQHNHQHISHIFTVPEGAARIDIDFRYEPKRIGDHSNLLTLSLFDPQGERGTGHRGQPTQHVTLSASDATPGYIPGPLLPGEWDIMVNANLINPGAAVSYDLEITIGFDNQPAAPTLWKRGTTNPRGPGWYRGDLHGHTLHSDGSWDVEGLVNFARIHKLDFVTLTDHNTISALQQMDSAAADDLLTMGGFELTTFYGHALALGVRDLIDWRVCPGKRTMDDALNEVNAANGLFVIAHPMAPGDPVCTGCHWDYEDVMPGQAKAVEVWNEEWESISNNEAAVQLWYQWLNQGYRLWVTVGTDIHGPRSGPEFGFNVVYAEALTEQAILEGVRCGHLYLSSGPQLTFKGISSTGQTAMIGDTLNDKNHTLNLQWSDCHDGDRLRLIVDGELKEETTVDKTGTKSWRLSGKHWYVIEIRDSRGYMRVLTNPIFAE